jgi:hypothetical protein
LRAWSQASTTSSQGSTGTVPTTHAPCTLEDSGPFREHTAGNKRDLPDACCTSSDANRSAASCCIREGVQPLTPGTLSICRAASGRRCSHLRRTVAGWGGSGELPSLSDTGTSAAEAAVRQLRQHASKACTSCAACVKLGGQGARLHFTGAGSAHQAPAGNFHSAFRISDTMSAGRCAHPESFGSARAAMRKWQQDLRRAKPLILKECEALCG